MFQVESFVISRDGESNSRQQEKNRSIAAQTECVEMNAVSTQNPVAVDALTQTDEADQRSPLDTHDWSMLKQVLIAKEPIISRILISNASSECFRNWNPWKFGSGGGRLEEEQEDMETLKPKLIGCVEGDFSRTFPTKMLVECSIWHFDGKHLIISYSDEESNEGYLVCRSALTDENSQQSVMQASHVTCMALERFRARDNGRFTYLLTGSVEGVLNLWTVDCSSSSQSSLNECAQSTKSHSYNKVTSVLIAKDEQRGDIESAKFISAGADGDVIVWKADLTKRNLVPVINLDLKGPPVTRLTLNRNFLVCATFNGILICRDLNSLRSELQFTSTMSSLNAHSSPIICLQSINKSHILSCSRDGTLRLWSPLTSRLPVKTINPLDFNDELCGVGAWQARNGNDSNPQSMLLIALVSKTKFCTFWLDCDADSTNSIKNFNQQELTTWLDGGGSKLSPKWRPVDLAFKSNDTSSSRPLLAICDPFDRHSLRIMSFS